MSEIPKRPEAPIVDLSKLQWSKALPNEFKELMFGTEEFDPRKGAHKELARYAQYTFQTVPSDGQELTLAGQLLSYDDRRSSGYLLYLGIGESFVSLEINIGPNAGHPCLVTDKIDRHDPREILPPRLGRDLYKTVFPFLQHIANVTKQQVDHLITRDSEIPKDKWEEIFLGMLMERGYEPKDPYYSKSYKPQA